jgi:hypothetical protein
MSVKKFTTNKAVYSEICYQINDNSEIMYIFSCWAFYLHINTLLMKLKLYIAKTY